MPLSVRRYRPLMIKLSASWESVNNSPFPVFTALAHLNYSSYFHLPNLLSLAGIQGKILEGELPNSITLFKSSSAYLIGRVRNSTRCVYATANEAGEAKITSALQLITAMIYSTTLRRKFLIETRHHSLMLCAAMAHRGTTPTLSLRSPDLSWMS